MNNYEKRCRICLDTDPILYDLCKCTDAYMHLDCAGEWFKYRIRGCMEGYAHEEQWSLYWYALCEVCKSVINPQLTRFALMRLKYPKITDIKDSYLFKILNLNNNGL